MSFFLVGVLFALTLALRRIEDDAAAADQLTMWQYAFGPVRFLAGVDAVLHPPERE